MKRFTLALIFASFIEASCTYNPFISNNRTTGSPVGAAVGAGVGAGSIALLGGPKWLMALMGIGGGAFGYYVTTLRYDAGGIIQGGGQVYTVGDFVGIYIPTDGLFEVNTAEFIPQKAPLILDSAAAVLKRYPDNSIMISGNTSGFSRTSWERRLSEDRAKKVAAYLWSEGVNDFKGTSIDTRRLTYVGYGDYFPISNHYTNEGIRQNSRIQITSYPTDVELELDPKHIAMQNFGSPNDYRGPCGANGCN